MKVEEIVERLVNLRDDIEYDENLSNIYVQDILEELIMDIGEALDFGDMS